jgi:hypothetical protein
MGWRNAVLAVLGILVLLLAASFFVDRFDASPLKPRIEAQFEHATGRALRIDGPLHLSLLPSPGIVAENVSVANLPGGSRPSMATVRKIAARFDLIALVERRIHIDSLLLDDPDILLETVGGEPNWRFHPGPRASTAAGGQPDVNPNVSSDTDESPMQQARARLNELDVEGGRVVWRDAGSAGSGAISIDALHAQQQDQSSFTVYLAARRGGAPFSLSLAAAPPPDDGQAGRPIPVRATLTLGHDENGARMHVDGNVMPHRDGNRFHGQVHAIVPQLADLDALFPHANLPHAADIQVQAVIGQTAVGRWRVLSLSGTGRQIDLDRFSPGLSIADVALHATAPDQGVSITANGQALGRPVSLTGILGSPDLWTRNETTGPVDATLVSAPDRAALKGTLSIPRTDAVLVNGYLSLQSPDLATAGALTFSARGTRDAHAVLDAASLKVRGQVTPPQRVTAAIKPDRILTVQSQWLGSPSSWLTWREDLATTPRTADLSIDAHDLPAAPLLAIALAPDSRSFLHDGRLTLRASLHGLADGASLEERTLDGPVEAVLTGADIDAASLGAIAHAAHLPEPAGRLPVSCAAGNGMFHSGVLSLDHGAMQSRLLSLTGSGRIDVPAGTLDLHVRPIVSLGPTDIETDLSMTGPIDAPHVALAEGAGHRFGLRIGTLPVPDGCATGPSVTPPEGADAPPAKPRRKMPNAAELLRSFGILH